ncbi:MAG TPA: hypothetical protein VJQ78_10885 [Sphingobium sp.]|nr:hypothetical protein [Sphingobium sp.]
MDRDAEDRKQGSAAERLMDAAEILIGERGRNGVSLREISRMAGQRNNYAVQYHFGDYLGLLRAHEARRIAQMEQRRAILYVQASSAGKLGDLRTLTDLLYLPVIDFRAADGERRYARFVLATLSGSPDALIDREAMAAAAESNRVLEQMGKLLPWLPMPLLIERQRLIAIMVLTSIFNRRAPFDAPSEDQALVDNALDMASSAVQAPVPSGLSGLVAAG